MGEAENQPFHLPFNTALKIEFQGSRVTSDGGLILVRELDERLGFSDLIAQHITDPRGKNTQFPLADIGPGQSYKDDPNLLPSRQVTVWYAVAGGARATATLRGRRPPGQGLEVRG